MLSTIGSFYYNTAKAPPSGKHHYKYFQRGRQYYQGLVVASLGTRLEKGAVSTCRLCRFFWQMWLSSSIIDRYELRVFPALWRCSFIRQRFMPKHLKLV
jgi:hypothetical protein